MINIEPEKLTGERCRYCGAYIGKGDGNPKACQSCVEDGIANHFEKPIEHEIKK